MARGDGHAALAAARAWSRSSPTEPKAWQALGYVAYRLGQGAEAVAALEQALALDPEDPSAQRMLANVLTAQGAPAAYARLETAARRTLAKAPTCAEAHVNLGIALARQGRAHEAEAAYRNALAVDPRSHLAHAGIAEIALADGRLDEAVRHFRQALAERLARGQISPFAPASAAHPFNRPEHLALLWHTLAQLAAAGFSAFATAGTLLGLVREGNLLAHDKDLDIGLPYAQLGRAFVFLQDHGWQAEPNPLRLVNPLALRHQSGLALDLLGYLDTGTEIVGGFWQAGQAWEQQRVTVFPSPLDLEQVTSPAGPVWALRQPERWLEALYGNWRQPDPHFDAVIAACNLRAFSPLVEAYALMRLDDHLHHGRLAKAQAIAQACLRHRPHDRLYQAVVDAVRRTLAQTP